ncbi:MAG: hypothetical protein M3R00_06555, partial [Pseudomonadota bacterium]|nr:hypothetical protein [Pseudomonadota bacterium]
YILPKKAKKSKSGKHATIQKIEAKIDSLPDVGDYVNKAALAGNLAVVQELLPILPHPNLTLLISDLHNALLYSSNKESSERECNMRAICEYLFEHAPHYRLFIKLQATGIRVNSVLQSGYSFLVTAAVGDKKLLFDMFIKQGFSPNRLGSFKCDAFYSILKFCTLICDNDYYVTRLIEIGAIIDLPKESIALNPQHSYSTLPSKNIANLFDSKALADKREETLYASLLETVDFPELSVACSKEKYSLIPLLLNGSSFYSQVHALGQLLFSKFFMRRFVPFTVTSGVFMFPSHNDTNQFHMSIHQRTCQDLNIALLSYPSRAISTEVFALFQTLVQAVKGYCNQHPNKIVDTIDKLETKAKTSHIQFKFISYIACQILYCELIQHYPERNNDIRQKLMHVICRYAMLVEKHLQFQAAVESYRHCEQLAMNNEFLQSTPTYLYAMKKIPPTVNPYAFTTQLRNAEGETVIALASNHQPTFQ